MIYVVNEIEFQPQKRTIRNEDGNFIKISESESLIFKELIDNVGQKVTKERLLSVGWPEKIVVTNALTVAISNLRNITQLHSFIKTEKSVGYSLSIDTNINYIDSISDVTCHSLRDSMLSEYDEKVSSVSDCKLKDKVDSNIFIVDLLDKEKPFLWIKKFFFITLFLIILSELIYSLYWWFIYD